MKDVKVKTTKEIRKAFVDEQDYEDRYVIGTYNFLSELYDMRVSPKFKLDKFFATLNQLTLKEELVIRYYYGIDRLKFSVEEIASKLHTSTAVVKATLTRGKKRFMGLMTA